MGFHADGAGEAAPIGPGLQLFLIVAGIEQAATLKAGGLAALRRETLPQVEALGRERQFTGIAVLLAAPAPVAAGLFAAMTPFSISATFRPRRAR
jgi:hypothetical protein